MELALPFRATLKKKKIQSEQGLESGGLEQNSQDQQGAQIEQYVSMQDEGDYDKGNEDDEGDEYGQYVRAIWDEEAVDSAEESDEGDVERAEDTESEGQSGEEDVIDGKNSDKTSDGEQYQGITVDSDNGEHTKNTDGHDALEGDGESDGEGGEEFNEELRAPNIEIHDRDEYSDEYSEGDEIRSKYLDPMFAMDPENPEELSKWNRHFWYHDSDDPEWDEDKETCHTCVLESWASHKLYPVTVSRIWNDPSIDLDPNFEFIEDSIFGENIPRAGDEYILGCECEDRVTCGTEECSCLDDLVAESRNKNNPHGYINSYYVSGRYKGCLRWELLESSREPIYECNAKCTCPKDCPNRVVGRGRKVSLNIFPTRDGRGWGVRAMEDIKKGQYVGRYVGEIITSEEANHRRSNAEERGCKDVYMFAMDKFSSKESLDVRLSGDPYVVDGEFKSGPTRFINHSCSPNLRVFGVVIDNANKHTHQLCFFALEDIQRETELTFDYLDGKSVKSKKEKAGKGKGNDEGKAKTPCLCGAANCRGTVF